MKTKSRRRRRSVSKRNPARRRRRAVRRRASLRNPMKIRRSRRRSRRMSLRNPARRTRRASGRRGFSFRNPMPGAISKVFNGDNMKLAAGALVYTTGTSILLNKMLASPSAAAGSIPGMKPGMVSPIGLTVYKGLIGVLTVMLTRSKFPKFAEGVGLGTVIVVGSDMLKQSNILSSLPGGGVSRYLPPPRGTGSYTPGVNSIFTGPGAGFIGGGAPRSRGMGTMMTGPSARNLVANGAAGFSNPN